MVSNERLSCFGCRPPPLATDGLQWPWLPLVHVHHFARQQFCTTTTILPPFSISMLLACATMKQIEKGIQSRICVR
jgi:hypothetical protein